MMKIFQAFRLEGFPSLYNENKHPVYGDILIYGFLFSFLILLFAFLVVIPGIRGKQKFCVLARVTVSLFIGGVILICNFGQEWEVSQIRTTTAYKAYTPYEINATIGVKIGLRSVNITLKAIGDKHKEHINETIDYNERFSWEWNQGRNGFGPQAGQIQRDFRAAQVKGLPYPILWIAEYFTFDGEGIRFGRHYRTAGWYSHIMMWLAFPLWILCNVLFCMVVQYGAYYLFLTGASMLTANIIFASIRNFLALKVPFQGTSVEMKYGWCFYLNLFTGLGSCILAIIIIWLDVQLSDPMATFFGIDVLKDQEDFYTDSEEKHNEQTMEDPSHQRPAFRRSKRESRGFRMRSFSLRKRVQQRATKRSTTEEDPDLPVYENIHMKRFDPIGEEEEINQAGSKENILKDMKVYNR